MGYIKKMWTCAVMVFAVSAASVFDVVIEIRLPVDTSAWRMLLPMINQGMLHHRNDFAGVVCMNEDHAAGTIPHPITCLRFLSRVGIVGEVEPVVWIICDSNFKSVRWRKAGNDRLGVLHVILAAGQQLDFDPPIWVLQQALEQWLCSLKVQHLR